MTIETHEAAFTAAQAAVLTCASLVDRVAAGELQAGQANRAMTIHLTRLLDTLDEAFTSSPDPRDDTERLVWFVRRSLDEIAGLLSTCPNCPLLEDSFLPAVTRWLDETVEHAQDTARLVATVAAWEEEPSRVAGPVTCYAAAEQIGFAVDLGIGNGLLRRMVLASLSAFGPQMAASLGYAYVREHRESRMFWDLLIAALDEVAAWAATTERSQIPDGFQGRSVEVLLNLAEDQVLSMYVVPRLPLHRLTPEQLHRLGELIRERDRPKSIDELGDDPELCTGSLESSYLWALEARTTRWPGLGT